MKLKHKDLLCIHDLSTEEVLLILDVAKMILDVAKKLKKMQKMGVPHEFCKGKTLAMMFSKASTRTRVSFETGFHQLGGHAIYLSDRDSQIGRGEPIRDTARVLSRMVDGIMIRTFSNDSVIELAEYASIPVINGLTDLLHPCQALTDLLTIEEQLGSLKGRKLVYVGDGNNMAHSLMYACAKVGMDMVWAWIWSAPVRKAISLIRRSCNRRRKTRHRRAAQFPWKKILPKQLKEPMYYIRMSGPAWDRKRNGKSA